MTARPIDKMVIWLEDMVTDKVGPTALRHPFIAALDKARELAAEDKKDNIRIMQTEMGTICASTEKPTEQNDRELVEELKDYLNTKCPPIPTYSLDEKEKGYAEGVKSTQMDLAMILSSHTGGKI